MKKLFKGVLFLALIGTVMVGCEKDESTPIETINNTNPHSTKTKTLNHKDGSNTTYISETNFDSEFDTFAEDFFTEYPNGRITGTFIEEINKYEITTDQNNPIDTSILKRVICRFGNDFQAMQKCLDRHYDFAIGFDGCAYGYDTKPYGDGSGRVWYNGFVDC